MTETHLAGLLTSSLVFAGLILAAVVHFAHRRKLLLVRSIALAAHGAAMGKGGTMTESTFDYLRTQPVTLYLLVVSSVVSLGSR